MLRGIILRNGRNSELRSIILNGHHLPYSCLEEVMTVPVASIKLLRRTGAGVKSQCVALLSIEFSN